jgi:C-terminal processing protease CtpA/Prc
VVLAINGDPPAPQDDRPRQVDFLYEVQGQQTITLALRRGGEQWEVKLTEDHYTFESQPSSQSFTIGQKAAAYLDLPIDVGTRLYPTDAQAAMAAVDSADTCGWIIDLRKTRGGDLWTYFAALSPILGDGQLGGFVYNDGSEESWRLEDGKVFWADEEREESYVRGRRAGCRCLSGLGHRTHLWRSDAGRSPPDTAHAVERSGESLYQRGTGIGSPWNSV